MNTICTYPNCIYQEQCPDWTLINSDTCNQLHQSCPHCNTAWDCTSHTRTCRELQATKALLREALGLLEEADGIEEMTLEQIADWHSRRRNLLARAGKGGVS
jgi:hypothetical protein